MGSGTLEFLNLRTQECAGTQTPRMFQTSPGGASTGKNHPSGLFPEEPVWLSMASTTKFGWVLDPTDRSQTEVRLRPVTVNHGTVPPVLQMSPHSDCCGGGHSIFSAACRHRVPPTFQLARPECQSCPTAPGHLRQGSLVQAGGDGHRAPSAP